MNSRPKPNQIGFQTTDETINSIYSQLQDIEASRKNANWLELRSRIYIRDKAICWICNDFVALPDYDLGHLVDRCMGGWDDYDNLAVMHTKCNLSKPHHTTLEGAMKWKLTRFIQPISHQVERVHIQIPSQISHNNDTSLILIKPRLNSKNCKCKYCQSENTKQTGMLLEWGAQYYKCNHCHRHFIIDITQ